VQLCQPEAGWIERLSWNKGDVGFQPFVGQWTDPARTFFAGSVVEILPTGWRVVDAAQDVDRNAEYALGGCFEAQGELFLIQRRSSGHEAKYEVTLSEDFGRLQVNHAASGRTWILEPVPDHYRLQDYQLWYEVISELELHKVIDTLDMAAPLAHRFLHALTVSIPSSMLKGRTLRPEQASGAVVEVLQGDFSGEPDAASQRALDDLVPRGAMGREAPWTWSSLFANKRARTEVQVFFTPLQHLLDFQSLEGLEVALCIAGAPDTSGLFCTPIAQGLTAKCWDLAFSEFAFQRVADFVFLVGVSGPLLYNSHNSHAKLGPPGLSKPYVCFMLLLAVRRLGLIVIEILVVLNQQLRHLAMNRLRPTHFVMEYLNLFTIVSLLIEVFSVSLIFQVVKQLQWWNDHHVDRTTLYHHPGYIVGLTFAQWLVWMHELTSLPVLASTFLPAWHAIRSRDSCIFLMFLFSLVVGTALAYSAFPVESIKLKPTFGISGFIVNWKQYYRCIFKMFRLTVLGDFSIEELKGSKSHLVMDKACIMRDLVMNSTNHSFKHCHGEVQGGKAVDWEEGLNLFVMMIIVAFPIIIVNVYIGLISEVYQYAKDNEAQILGDFRLANTFRHILRRYFWGQVTHCCARRPSSHRRSRVSVQVEVGHEAEGTGLWIVLPQSMVGQPSAWDSGTAL